jgi:hypothetical protein
VDLIKRVESLEQQLDGNEAEKSHIHTPKDGSWQGEDFSI